MNLPRLLATKFAPPQYGDNLVERGGLMERLDAGRSRRLMLIQAPAGYGKTTLAAQWRDTLCAAGLAASWVCLDEDDNDLVRFLSYLVAALGKADASLAQDLGSILETHPQDVARFVLADLVNSIAALDRDVFLLVDDWHVIRQPEVQDAMQYLLMHASANLHVLIATRAEPACNLTRLRVEDEMVEIGAADLRFSMEESRAFLQDINRVTLRDDALDRLWRATDGWVAALQLASLSIRSGEDPDETISGLSAQPRSIGDYLAENVLDNLPHQTLEFLLRSSILERLSGPLCAAVTGFDDSQKMLEELERQELFVRALQADRRWFRYHHLFAAYLQRRLERDHPGQSRVLHQSASEWFAAEGFTAEAVNHALAAGARDRAVALVERDAMWLVQHSRMANLLGLVRRLHAAELEQRPWLQIAVAWAHTLMHHLASAQQVLDAMGTALDRDQDSGVDKRDELLIEARVVQGVIDIFGDRIDRVETLVKPYVDHTEGQRPWIVAVATNVLTYAAIHSLEFDYAHRLQAWAAGFHRRTQGPFSGIYGQCFAGMASVYQGELKQAASAFEDALALATQTVGARSHAARLASALLGQIHYEYHELDRAEQLLEESRALGAEGGVADFSLATYISLARLKAVRGEFAEAHALLDEGMETARVLGLGRLAAAVDGERVRLYIADGEIHLAERLLVDDRSGSDNIHGIEMIIVQTRQLAAARVLFAQGRLGEAEKLLARLLGRARKQGRRVFEVGLHVLIALVRNELRPNHGENHLLEALELAAPQGMVRTFLDEGSKIVAPLERVRGRLRRGRLAREPTVAISGHIDRLLVLAREQESADVRTAPAGPPASDPAPVATAYVEPLKQREREVLVLVSQGWSNKEIARTLGLGVETVKWYLKGIYGKLCVNRRTQAVAEAKRLGVLE